MTLHITLLLKCSSPFQLHLVKLNPRIKLEILASMPLLHFFNRVSMFLLLTMFFRLPTILLKTILMKPFSCAYSALALDAYPPSVALSLGTLPYESINLFIVPWYKVLSAGLPLSISQIRIRLLFHYRCWLYVRISPSCCLLRWGRCAIHISKTIFGHWAPPRRLFPFGMSYHILGALMASTAPFARWSPRQLYYLFEVFFYRIRYVINHFGE